MGSDDLETDARGVQRGTCPDCDRRSDHHVETIVGENGTISKKSCVACGAGWVERYVGGRDG